MTTWLIKVGWETLATPLTYALVGYLKRTEGIDVYDFGGLARLQRIQRDSEGDRHAPVDAPIGIAAELEDVAVAEADGPDELAHLAAVHEDRELEEDRDELAVGDEVDRPAEERDRHAPLLRRGERCSSAA